MEGRQENTNRGDARYMIKEINPPQAWGIMQSNPDAVLVDVRSWMEFEYVGHVPDSVFVALKEPPGWETEPRFVDNVKKALLARNPDKHPQDLTVLVICRSGARSMAAAVELTSKGFKEAINVAEGFEGDKNENGQRSTINGWRFHSLPWQQS